MATTITTTDTPQKIGEPLELLTMLSGQALEFDGVNDYITWDSLTLDDDFTIALWIKVEEATSWLAFVANNANASNFIGYFGNGYFGLRFSDGTGVNNIAIEEYMVGQWNRMVVTRDKSASEMYVYYNGKLVKTITSSDYGNINNDLVTQSLGAWTGGYYHINAKVSDYQIWDKKWELSDVQYDYKHPDRLILDNGSLTSGITQSNIMLWYPMNNENAKTPQTSILNAKPIELGPEMLTNTEFSGSNNLATYWTGIPDNWTCHGGGTGTDDANHFITGSNGEVRIASNFTNNTAYYSSLLSASLNIVAGKTYKLTFSAKKNTVLQTIRIKLSVSTNFAYAAVAGGLDEYHTDLLTDEFKEYTFYCTPTASDAASYLIFGRGTSGAPFDAYCDFTIKNPSFKEVIGNSSNATTKFYGDELINENKRTFTHIQGDELIRDVVNRDFSSTSYWGEYSPDGAAPSFSKTNYLSITPDASDGNRVGGQLSSSYVTAAVVGKTYKVSANIWWNSSAPAGANDEFHFYFGGAASGAVEVTATATGTIYSANIVAASTDSSIYIYKDGTTNTQFFIDNVSVKEINLLRTGSELNAGETPTHHAYYEIIGWDSGSLHTELITTPDFSSSSGWTLSGDTDWTIGSNIATNDGTETSSASKNITAADIGVVRYKKYRIGIDVGDAGSTTARVKVMLGSNSVLAHSGDYLSVGTGQTFDAICGADHDDLIIRWVQGTPTVDNVSVKEIVDFTDYGSPNNNIGTIFCMNHSDGTYNNGVVPTLSANNKLWAIDLGAGGNNSTHYGLAPKGDNKIYCMGPEIVPNPDFETALDSGNWISSTSGSGPSVSLDTSIYNSGSQSCKLVAASSGGAALTAVVSQNLMSKLIVGKMYRFNMWGYGTGSLSPLIRLLYVGDNSSVTDINGREYPEYTDPGLTAAAWNQYGFYFVAEQTSVSLKLVCPSTNSATVYVDDISVREVDLLTVEYNDASGSAADNVTEGSSMYIRSDNTYIDAAPEISVKYKFDFVASETGGNSDVLHYNGSTNTSSTVDGSSQSYPTFGTESLEVNCRSGTTDYIRIGNNLTTDEQIHIREISYKEVGISDGWTESDAQEVIPQNMLKSGTSKLTFNGVYYTSGNPYVDFGTCPLTNLTNFSINVWAKKEPNTGTFAIIARDDDAGGSYLRYDNDDDIIFHVNTSATDINVTATNGQLNHGEWEMFTVTFTVDGSGDSVVQLYRNGQLINDRELSGVGTGGLLDNFRHIGRYGLTYGTGLVDEISKWNKVLSYDEVRELYTDSIPQNALEHSANNNLVGYWRNNVLDDNHKWKDLNNLENITMDGSNDVGSISGTFHDLRDNNNEMTVTFWAKHTDFTADQWIGITAGSVLCYVKYFYDVGSDRMEISVALGAGGDSANNYYFPNSVKDEGWSHIAFTFDSNDLGKIYRNNEMVWSGTLTRAANAYYNNIQTGRDRSTSSYSKGKIDQISTWSTALSASNISDIYALGRDLEITSLGLSGLITYHNFEAEHVNSDDTIKDLSGNGNHMTLTGGLAITDSNPGTVYNDTDHYIFTQEGLTKGRDSKGFFNNIQHPSTGAAWFNGYSSYINAGKNSTIDDTFDDGGTVEAWIKPICTSSHGIVDKTGWNLHLRNHGGGECSIAFYHDFSGDQMQAWSDTRVISTNKWAHIAVTYDNSSTSNNPIMYLNGVVTASSTDGSPVGTKPGVGTRTSDSSSNLLIGYDSQYYFKGFIDEVRVYKKILSADEVLKNYTRNISGHQN